MIELFKQNIRTLDRHSSKGNQLKWNEDGIWYKADFMGYEGLAEYLVSQLLKKSSLNSDEFVLYEPEQIKYNSTVFNGSKSNDFLVNDTLKNTAGWQIITLERLFKIFHGVSLYETIWKFANVRERLEFLVQQTERITGITSFGPYMAKLLTIDAIFLNEDRHTHNIAVLMNSDGDFRLCPVFDNGACLLSDTTMDYPLDADIYEMIDRANAKTVSSSFDEQLDAVEELYGRHIEFSFSGKDID